MQRCHRRQTRNRQQACGCLLLPRARPDREAATRCGAFRPQRVDPARSDLGLCAHQPRPGLRLQARSRSRDGRLRRSHPHRSGVCAGLQQPRRRLVQQGRPRPRDCRFQRRHQAQSVACHRLWQSRLCLSPQARHAPCGGGLHHGDQAQARRAGLHQPRAMPIATASSSTVPQPITARSPSWRRRTPAAGAIAA